MEGPIDKLFYILTTLKKKIYFFILLPMFVSSDETKAGTEGLEKKEVPISCQSEKPAKLNQKRKKGSEKQAGEKKEGTMYAPCEGN